MEEVGGLFRGNIEQLPPLHGMRIELFPKPREDTDMVEALNNTVFVRSELREI